MTEADKTESTKRRQAGRSPSYPSFAIKEGLAKVEALRAKEGDYAAPLTSAFAAWGYGEKSSGGRQTLATLRYYGLIDVAGEGDARKIKVSDIARRILLDQREDDSEKKRLIRQVALTPAAHKALFDEYPTGLASDGSVHHFLVFNLQFNPDAARELLAEFKETAEFVGLYKPSPDVDKKDQIGEGDKDPIRVPVGAKIQWTSAGVDQFQEPALVLGTSDDGKWLFTDQGKAAVPIEGVTIVEEPADELGKPPEMPAHLLSALQARKAAAAELPKGHEVLTSGKLKSGSFEVRVTGEITAADISRIRKMLEAQEAILRDDEADTKSE